MSETGKEIAKIVQMANRLSARVMREEGLGKAEADLVRLVREQPGISQKIASETLNMDKGAVTRRAVNLEKKGYLTRKNNPADARSQLLYPADRVERFKGSDASVEEAFYQWLFDTLPEAERAAFYDTVRKLSRSAETESNDGFPDVCERLGRPAFETETGSESRPRKPAGTANGRGSRMRKPTRTESGLGNRSRKPTGTDLPEIHESTENVEGKRDPGTDKIAWKDSAQGTVPGTNALRKEAAVQESAAKEAEAAAEAEAAREAAEAEAAKEAAGDRKTKSRRDPDVWLL